MATATTSRVGPKRSNIATYTALVVISIFCLLPFVWMFLASVDSNAQLFLKWPDSWTLDNYTRVFAKEDGVLWFGNCSPRVMA